MKRFLTLCTWLAMTAGLGNAQTLPTEPRRMPDTVSVEAEGSFDADPDVATLRFSVSVQEKELARAYEKANAALQRIFGLAEQSGISKPDVVTGALFVTPQYDWSDRKRRARSYRVENEVQIRLRDFTKVGTLIDEALNDEMTEFRSVTYFVVRRRDGQATRRSGGDAAGRRARPCSTGSARTEIGAVAPCKRRCENFCRLRMSVSRGEANTKLRTSAPHSKGLKPRRHRRHR